jgi:glyoxylase-like metal-dependent hydrolase (beta-lactamase superfamily II)
MEYETLEFEFPPSGRINVFRVGDTLVDTGHLAGPGVEGIRRELATGRLRGVRRVLVTHPHVDHVGGSQAIPELTALPHVCHTGVGAMLDDYRDHVLDIRADIERFVAGTDADLGYFESSYPLEFDYPSTIPVERELTDGDTVTLGDEVFEAVHTPGHSGHHLAFAHDSGLVFTGDLVLPHQQFMWGPVDYDVGAYHRSLRRLRDRRPDRLVPSHGPPIERPGPFLDACLDNVERTLARLRELLAERGRIAVDDVVDDLFGIAGLTGPPRHFFCCTAGTFFDYLAARGEARTERTDEGYLASAT